MPRDPYRLPPDMRPTNALPRVDPPEPPETRRALEEAKAFAREAEDEIQTMCRCPLCAGCGLVSPEIASTFDVLCKEAKEQT